MTAALVLTLGILTAYDPSFLVGTVRGGGNLIQYRAFTVGANVGNGKVKYRIFGSSSTKNSAIKMQSFRQWKYKDFGNGFACSNSNIPGGVRSS